MESGLWTQTQEDTVCITAAVSCRGNVLKRHTRQTLLHHGLLAVAQTQFGHRINASWVLLVKPRWTSLSSGTERKPHVRKRNDKKKTLQQTKICARGKATGSCTSRAADNCRGWAGPCGLDRQVNLQLDSVKRLKAVGSTKWRWHVKYSWRYPVTVKVTCEEKTPGVCRFKLLKCVISVTVHWTLT